MAFALCLPTCFASATAFAYRTGEDSPELAGRGRVAWTSNSVGFWMSEAGLPAGVTKEQMELALVASLEAWSAPECSQIEPFFAGWTGDEPLARDGKNTIGWLADWAERGFPEMAPGNTDMQYRGHDNRWDIAEADVYLDAADYEWTTIKGEDTSLPAVLTHELGHALGLLHTCEPDGADTAPDCNDVSPAVESTTMYPFYDAGEASLDEDDVAGICYLYPVGNDCGNCSGRGQVCMDGECRVSCREGVCAAGQICGFWGCVPDGACILRECTGEQCETNDSCGPLAQCRKGQCVRGDRALGDACTANHDCAEGSCVGSVCQPDCDGDLECAPFGSCVGSDDGEVRGCIASGAYPDGATCSAGEDCHSSICILTEKRNTCTSECTSSDSCLRDWSCKRVDGRSVCVPPAIEPAGGCSFSVRGGARASVAWMLVAAALLATRKRSKRNDR